MRVIKASKAIALAVLLGGAAAQALADETVVRHELPRDQNPLRYTAADSNHHFTKKRQDNTTCPTYGESQWTGTINVSKGHDIFYWYFDSRNDPKNDPVIIWLSGGPGASSLGALFTGHGPCWLKANASHAAPNPLSWNNNASILFIDQPAGTGFSKLADDLPLPVSEQDTAQDFQQFLSTFFTDVFPEKKHLPMHLATASYGGHYGPVYLHHILESRRYGSSFAFWGDIQSLILIDAVIDFTGIAVGSYNMLCKDRERVGLLNATACASIARHMPEQLRLGRSCQLAYHGEECRASYDYGQKYIHAPMNDLVNAGKINLANSKFSQFVSAMFPASPCQWPLKKSKQA